MKIQKTVLTSRIDLLDVSNHELFLMKRGLAMFADRDRLRDSGTSPETAAADNLIKQLEMLIET